MGRNGRVGKLEIHTLELGWYNLSQRMTFVARLQSKK
jgi:hypothetical protein